MFLCLLLFLFLIDFPSFLIRHCMIFLSYSIFFFCMKHIWLHLIIYLLINPIYSSFHSIALQLLQAHIHFLYFLPHLFCTSLSSLFSCFMSINLKFFYNSTKFNLTLYSWTCRKLSLTSQIMFPLEMMKIFYSFINLNLNIFYIDRDYTFCILHSI